MLIWKLIRLKLDRLKTLRESKAGCSKNHKAATFLPHSFKNRRFA